MRRRRHGVICLFTDLSSVVALEEQVRLKDSLARVGELTAGIAHEFRNGLATIHGYSRLLDLDALQPGRQYVEGIRAETEAMREVVTNFLNFARPTQLTLSPVDLRAVAERAADDLRADARALGGDIVVAGEFATIDGDDVLLRQAFSNLLRNAIEACAGASLAPVIVMQSRLDPAGGLMRISVDDNGPGISPSERRKVFPALLHVKAHRHGSRPRTRPRRSLRLALEAQGHLVVEARDQREAEAALLASHPAIVLSDLRLSEGDGFGVLRAAKELDPDLPVIVMTAYGSIQDAVVAMKEGALDFLAKPVDPDHLLLMVERALAQRRMATENLILKEELAQRRGAPQIVGDDPKLKQVSLALHRAAATDTTVLLEGESGTGKELFARALHALSPRADGPFVAINCAAIPETLLETELFGNEKGAFTGAAARKPGKFELAHRGTLFLDEIGDLPPMLQPKILRALEEKRFERVGGTVPLQVDVRVVAATNRNLKAAVAARQYREDLYFRLSVFPIVIPPLA